MSAPKENQFWKIRSKHGRDKLFATPELLLECATEYFTWCDKHPFQEVRPMTVTNAGRFTGSSIKKIKVPKRRPYSLIGLCIYIGCNTEYFHHFKKSNKDEGFSQIIHVIEQTIYQQKFDGAAVGDFNSNIIARDLGLREQTDVTSKGRSIAPIPESLKNASVDELRQFLREGEPETNDPV